MSTAKSIAKNTAFLFMGEVADKVLSFFLVILLTRYLGSEGFGIYSFAFAFVGMCVIFSNLGVTTYMFRELPKEKEHPQKLVNNVMTLAGAACIIVLGVAIFFSSFWEKTSGIVTVLLLAGILQLFEELDSIQRTIFSAYERTEFRLFSMIIEKSLYLIFGGTLLLKGYALPFILLGLLIARIATYAFDYILLYKKMIRISWGFDISYWKGLIARSMPFWLTVVFIVIYYQTDRIMLGILTDYYITGWYSAAATLINALTFIPNVMVHATFPAMSKFFYKGMHTHLSLLYEKTISYLLMVSMPIMIGTIMLADRIIAFMYKEAFAQSALVLKILSFSLIFIFINHIMGYLLNSINKQNLFFISTSFSALANVLLNFLLIPPFKHGGAAVATVLSQALNGFILWYYTRKEGYTLHFRLFIRPLAAGLVMALLIFLLRYLAIIYLIPIAGITYFAVLTAIGGFGKEEYTVLLSFFPRKAHK